MTVEVGEIARYVKIKVARARKEYDHSLSYSEEAAYYGGQYDAYAKVLKYIERRR